MVPNQALSPKVKHGPLRCGKSLSENLRQAKSSISSFKSLLKTNLYVKAFLQSVLLFVTHCSLPFAPFYYLCFLLVAYLQSSLSYNVFFACHFFKLCFILFWSVKHFVVLRKVRKVRIASNSAVVQIQFIKLFINLHTWH